MHFFRKGSSLAALALLLVASCSAGKTSCGDGHVDPGETCDEGPANGSPGHCRSDCSVPGEQIVSIEGDAMAFASEVSGPRVADAKITVLEHPEKTATTGPDGHFKIDGLPIGGEVTLVLEHPDFHILQSATVVVGANGVAPFTLQPVSNALFTLLASVVAIPIDPADCNIATTVTRLGGSLYVALRQGEAGATVALSPASTAKGPIYFNESVIPDPKATATSKDGGVVIVNVPPGDYVLSGAKAGLVFAPVKIKCRAGLLVNAGPALGVAADLVAPDYGAGSKYPADAFSASTDALCDRTADCVTTSKGAGAYPDATRASCKAMFKNVWSFIDTACDPSGAFKNAGRTLFTCRAASCQNALGGDEVCAPEDKAYVDAMQTYGACYANAHAK